MLGGVAVLGVMLLCSGCVSKEDCRLEPPVELDVFGYGGVSIGCVNCADLDIETGKGEDTEGVCVNSEDCCGGITVFATCAKVCANIMTFAKRCSGSFCNALITTCSIAMGRWGICVRRGGGGVSVCFTAISAYDP